VNARYTELCSTYGVADAIGEFDEEFDGDRTTSSADGSSDVEPVTLRTAMTRIQRAMSAPVLPGLGVQGSSTHQPVGDSAQLRPQRYLTESALPPGPPLSVRSHSQQVLLAPSAPSLEQLTTNGASTTANASASLTSHCSASGASAAETSRQKKRRSGFFGSKKDREERVHAKEDKHRSLEQEQENKSKKKGKASKGKGKSKSKKQKKRPKDKQALAELEDLEADLETGADSGDSDDSDALRKHAKEEEEADAAAADADAPPKKSRKEAKREEHARKQKERQRRKEERASEKQLKHELKPKKRGFFRKRKKKHSPEALARDLEQIDASTFGNGTAIIGMGGEGGEGGAATDESAELECPICLEEFPISNTTTLACGHRYCIRAYPEGVFVLWTCVCVYAHVRT
jgi:hypothetical protein